MARDCRAAAARALAGVMAGQSLNQSLPPQLEQVAPRDRALLQELCYGTLRHWPRLDGLLEQLLEKPLRDKDRDIRALLAVGLYQLDATRVPDHAAVASTVAATAPLKKAWARGLANAVLRRYLRERETLEAPLTAARRAAHPDWLYQRLATDCGTALDSVLAANNARPPMTLRVNLGRSGRDDYLRQLEAAGIRARPGELAASALYLEQPVDVSALPGFEAGMVSVQDEAAQLAAQLLDARDGQRVLDACAAPGGKTCHILERAREQGANVDLLALDNDPERAERVRENLGRLALTARLAVADASHPPAALAQERFDRILVDAPCSATGVIRRHPDIKLLRRETDIARLAREQGAILDGLWPLLKPGGRLLYVTCSVLQEENHAVVEAFLQRCGEARLETLAVEWGEPRDAGRQLLPREGGPDGLYFAALTRVD